ncbi:MAG: hypothetical protein SFV18_13925 [Bryobacteraceae bacterium]|nr:hypothetical protein [Bryobacteraceae bacterium]
MEVLSLNTRFAEMDRQEVRRVVSFYSKALREAAERAIRFDDDRVNEFREALLHLAEELEGSGQHGLDPIHEKFGESMAAFQRDGEGHLRTLREKLEEASGALANMVVSVSDLGTSHQADLEQEVDRLRLLQHVEDIVRLRAELADATARMSASLEGMRREHQMVVTQMRDEIRSLHREMESRSVRPPRPEPVSAEPAETPAPASEPTIGTGRREIERLLRDRTEADEPVTLLIVWMRNLAPMFTQHPPELVLDLMAAASARLDQVLQGRGRWSKWEDDCYIVCVPRAKSEVTRVAQDVAMRLNEGYLLQRCDGAHHLALKVSIGMVDRTKDESADTMLARAGKLTTNMRSRPQAA